jgi:FHA domain-containing protein/CHAT domain-containing protein
MQELARLPDELVREIAVAGARLGLTPSRGQTIEWSEARGSAVAREVGGTLRDCLSLLVPEVSDARSIRQVRVAAGAEPAIPWEMTLGPGDLPWGVNRQISVLHGDDASSGGDEVIRPGPLRVVVASCMPVGLPSANVDAQRLVLGQMLAATEPSRQVPAVWLENPMLEQVRTAVASDTTLLHVIAHGRPGHILWHEAGEPAWLGADEFCRSLGGTDATLVSFCVCDSAYGEEDGGGSLAAGAVRTFARSAIGIRGLLGDAAGVTFFQGLLTGLTHQVERVDQIVAETRARLLEHGRGADWARPVLFVRDAVPRLRFDVADGEANSPDRVPRVHRHAWLTIGSERVPLGEKAFLIGRSASADMVVRARDVAPFHAAIDSTPSGGHEVRDQTGSGLLLNGRSVSRSALADGDLLSLGGREVRYRSGGRSDRVAAAS